MTTIQEQFVGITFRLFFFFCQLMNHENIDSQSEPIRLQLHVHLKRQMTFLQHAFRKTRTLSRTGVRDNIVIVSILGV